MSEFPYPTARTPLSTHNLRRVYQAAVAAAGEDLAHLDLHGPHDLRHTFATWLEDAGIPSRVIDELMGHIDGRRGGGGDGSPMGRIYRETTPAMLARVTAALDERIGRAMGVVRVCCASLRDRQEFRLDKPQRRLAPRFMRTSYTPSRLARGAAGGRPPGDDTTLTGEPASPHTRWGQSSHGGRRGSTHRERAGNRESATEQRVGRWAWAIRQHRRISVGRRR